MPNCFGSQDSQNLKQKKKYSSTKDLKEGELILMKNYNARAFQPKYLADYRVIKVENKNAEIVTSPDGRKRKCNILHIKPISPAEAFTSAFQEFTKCIKETILTRQPSLQGRGNHIITSSPIINASM